MGILGYGELFEIKENLKYMLLEKDVFEWW